MVIFELGIIRNGVSIVSKEYYKEHGMNIDSTLRGGFLSAMTSFAGDVFSDEIEEFSMRNFKITLITRSLESGKIDLIVYCIGDKKVNLHLVNDALRKILQEFVQKYSISEIDSDDMNTFIEFEQIIDQILGDLIKSSADRLRSIFG